MKKTVCKIITKAFYAIALPIEVFLVVIAMVFEAVESFLEHLGESSDGCE